MCMGDGLYKQKEWDRGSVWCSNRHRLKLYVDGQVGYRKALVGITLMHVDSPKTLGQIFRKGILILTQDIYCEDVRAQSNVRSIYTQHTAE